MSPEETQKEKSEWEKAKLGEEAGQIRGCRLEGASLQWWSMISKICDELGVEDKSRKEGRRRILSTLNGFFPRQFTLLYPNS